MGKIIKIDSEDILFAHHKKVIKETQEWFDKYETEIKPGLEKDQRNRETLSKRRKKRGYVG